MSIKLKRLPTGENAYSVSVVRKANFQGREVRASREKHGVKTHSQALQVEKELIGFASRDLEKKLQLGSSWSELLDRYEVALESGRGLERNVTASVAHDYMTVIRKYTGAWNSRPVKEITRSDIRYALESVILDGKSTARKKMLKIVIKGAFDFAIENRFVPGLVENPALGIAVKVVKQKEPRVLNRVEQELFLKTALELKHAWYPIWATALLTGMRNGELFALSWTDVDFENEVISVTKSFNKRSRTVGPTKGRYRREVPMNADLVRLFKELQMISEGRLEVFQRHRDWCHGEQARITREFCVGLGISGVSFHDLRATFSTELMRQGTPPAVVMKICGWQSLATMQTYIRLAGIEVRGATDSLRILPERECVGRVVKLSSLQSS